MNFNESDLIAYQLHELSPRRTRALRRALAVDPTLAAEAEAIAFTLRAFAPMPAPTVDAALLDRTWNAIRPSLLKLPPPTPLRLWRVPMTAAAGLTLTAAAVLWFALLSAGRSVHTPPISNPTIAHTPTTSWPQPQQLTSIPHNTVAQNTTPTIVRPTSNKPQVAKSTATSTAALHNALRLPSTAPLPTNATNVFHALPLELQQPFTAPDNTLLALSQSSATTPLPAQTASTGPSALSARHMASHPVHEHETDVSVGGFADLTADSTVGYPTQGHSQSIRPTAGVLISFHQQLRRSVGYQVSAAYSQTTFDYSYTAANSNSSYTTSGLVPAKIVELSGDYVVEGPKSHRLSTHAGAGAGMLTFIPDASPQQSYGFRAAGVATASIDYHLKHHWSLRAEYRALFFRGPNFRNTNGSIPVISRITVSSQPTLSLDYRFGPLIRP